jgi:4-hydroxy-tetrahydrodipicolinate synthase
MDMSQFRGTTVALITPFLKDGSIDRPRLKGLLDWQIAEGTGVILTMGTTGESATLSHTEHEEVIELVVQHVKGRVPVMAGAGSNSTQEAVRLTQFATKAGADAILSVGPYYNKPTQEGYYQHFKAVAEATDLPVVLYNVPGRTGSNISAQTTLRLAEVPNIGAVKEASGDLSQIMAIIQDRPDGFLVLSGDDAMTLPMLALGADGIISVVANETPALLKEMVTAAFSNNWEKARDLHYKLLPLMEINFIESNPIPVKTAVALMGKIEDNFRLPLVKMTDENKNKLTIVLNQLKLL